MRKVIHMKQAIKIPQGQWIKHWAGHFNFVYDTLLGLHNTVLLKKYLGVDLGRAMYIYRKEYTFAYFKESDYKNFGKNCAEEILNNGGKALMESIRRDLKK